MESVRDRFRQKYHPSISILMGTRNANKRPRRCSKTLIEHCTFKGLESAMFDWCLGAPLGCHCAARDSIYAQNGHPERQHEATEVLQDTTLAVVGIASN